MIGQMIGSHRIISKLGQGGMGTVYQAEDARLGRRVAIKVLNPSLTANSKELARFQSEAKVQASLNHPNIATLYELEPYGDSFYIVMEYVEGKNLAEIVRMVGALPHNIVVNLSKQILDGLSIAHRHGVVHRDLKPSNIMVTPDGVAKVMDFGLAKVQGEKSLTASHALVGTVYYMSPEQVRGEAVDARSDIYSFGIILFELLTGRVPFKEESDFPIMMHHVQTPPPPPTQFLPDIPGALEDIVLRCLEKSPVDRFQNANEIIAALDAFEEQERAPGRSNIYTRRYLSQWLVNPSSESSISDSEAPTVFLDPSARDSKSRAATATTPQQIPASKPAQEPARSTSIVGPLLISMVLVVLLAGGGTYFYVKRHGVTRLRDERNAPSQVVEIRIAPAQKSQVSSSPPPAPPAGPEPSQAASAAIPGPSPQTPVNSASVVPPESSKPGIATKVQPEASPKSVSGASRLPVTPASPAPSLPVSASLSPRVRATPLQPARQPAGFLIFIDQDQSGQKLPLGSAQAQVADILRQEGHEVVSAGVVSQGIRSSLDRGDLAAVRGQGVGYVVLGTAHGSLDSQTAYGSTYYFGKVRATFELVRMSDGKIACTGSGNAKSRGTTNAEEALANALLTATSDAAREMLRNFRP